MVKHDALSSAIPHTGRGKWVAALVAALVVVGTLIWVVASGFQGRHIQRNAEAITAPITSSPANGATRPGTTAPPP